MGQQRAGKPRLVAAFIIQRHERRSPAALHADVLPAAIGQCRAGEGQGAMELFQAVQAPPVIRIQEGDEIAPGVLEPQIPGRIGATPILVQQLDAAGVGFRKTLQNFHAVIHGAVVDDDQFHVGITLPHDRSNRLAQIGRRIETGHDDGDQRDLL